MIKNGTRPAHPLNGDKWQKEIGYGGIGHFDYAGLTKREYFAALAMQAMLSNHKYFNLPIDQLCGFATVASDKLLNALES